VQATVVAVQDDNESGSGRGADPSVGAAERTSYLPRIAARRPFADEPAASGLQGHSGELPEAAARREAPDVESTVASAAPDPETAAITAATRELPVVDADGHGDEAGSGLREVPEGPDIPLLTHGADTGLRGTATAGGEHAANPGPALVRAGLSQPSRASRRRRRRRAGVLVLTLVVLAAAAAAVYWLSVRGRSASLGVSQHRPATAGAGALRAAARSRRGRGGAPATATMGAFAFTKHHGPVRSGNCAEHSYGRTHRFLAHTPCRWVSRTLYASSTPKGSVVSSVSVVRMPSARQAAMLKRITEADGTGNVTDLVSDGINVPGGPSKIWGQGYVCEVRGTTVTIVESGSAGGRAGNAYLKRVSAGAARMVH
jgi:hypothetical protein